MSIVSENIISSIAKEFEHQLYIRDYNYNSEVVKDIVTESIESKAKLIEMFRKHPNWNEEKLMIAFNADFERRKNIEEIDEFLKWLRYCTPVRKIITSNNWCKRNLYEEIAPIAYDTTLQSEEVQYYSIEAINKLKDEFRFREGMKTSRVINKICTSYGWDKLPENEFIDKYGVKRNRYDVEFAKYADALNPTKITRHTCISVNPVDFLLMSHGNSWKSCHYIGDNYLTAGMCSSGTISYALDNHSFIFYTVPADYDGNSIETEPKILRQVFGYNDNQLLQSRLYPQENDVGAAQTYENIRNVVQTVISKCKDVPNRWVKKTHLRIKQGAGSTCYPDWDYNKKCNRSVLRDFDCIDEYLDKIVMGAPPRCIKCGKYHYISENINHCGNEYTCTCCGAEIRRTDVIWIDDDPYCEECAERVEIEKEEEETI